MLNIRDNNEMLYHFSEKFRNSECMEFLNSIFDKYAQQLSLVHFSNYSYHKNLYGIDIGYYKDEEKGTQIFIKQNNNYIGNLTININKYKNNITIVDNLHYFTDLDKDTAKVIRLAISKDSTSYIEYGDYKNYYSPRRELIKFNKLVIDSAGNLIDYCDEKYNDNTKLMKTNNKK